MIFHEISPFSWNFMKMGEIPDFSRKMRFGAKWPPKPIEFLRNFMVSGEGRGFCTKMQNFWKSAKSCFFWKFRKFHDFREIYGIFVKFTLCLRRPRALPGPPISVCCKYQIHSWSATRVIFRMLDEGGGRGEGGSFPPPFPPQTPPFSIY